MLENPFEKEKQRINNLLLKAMEESMVIIEADTKLLTPVLSGTLKRSYTHDVSSEGDMIIGSVGTNVSYAWTVDQKQPHLSAAVDMNRGMIQEKFKETLSTT